MKTNYEGFRGWINYIRDYKDNKNNDLISEQRLIDLRNEKETNEKVLNERIKQLEENCKEKDHLLELRNQRIDVLTQKCVDIGKRCDELRRNVSSTVKENNELHEKLDTKEKARRKSAGAIGGLKAKINELTEELAKANYTIDYYRKSKKPNVEEIKAYDLGHKEVEKRQKNK